jgi:CcmD family protein
MVFMVAAYLVIWLAAFVFIFSMMQRQRSIQRDIATLRELTREREEQR